VKASMAVYKEKAKIFKALSHPTRLFMVDRLFAEEMCVTDLMEGLEADISTVSKHLSVLKNAGIVRDERRGSMVFYSLAMPCVVDVFNCVAKEVEQKSGISPSTGLGTGNKESVG
jgi:ArsR family transcriptional regulator